MAAPRLPTNIVYEWTGTGTGSLSLGTPVTGFQALTADQDGVRLVYEIIHADNVTKGVSSERELGWGTWTNATTTLNRADGPGSSTTDGVIHSTAATSTNRESFTSGTKYVAITLTGELIDAVLLQKEAGGAVLSDAEFQDYAETSPSQSGVTGGVTIDFAAGPHHEITHGAGNITSVTVNNWPASGKTGSLTVDYVQDGTGGRTVTHPSGTVWAGGAPTFDTAASKTNRVTYVTRDGGTEIVGHYGGAW